MITLKFSWKLSIIRGRYLSNMQMQLFQTKKGKELHSRKVNSIICKQKWDQTSKEQRVLPFPATQKNAVFIVICKTIFSSKWVQFTFNHLCFINLVNSYSCSTKYIYSAYFIIQVEQNKVYIKERNNSSITVHPCTKASCECGID